MKVLVVSLNRERIPDVVAPIGCAYVLETILRSGHDAAFCDLLFADDPLAHLSASITSEQPDLICLSVRNLDRSVAPQLSTVFPWIRQVAEAAIASGRRVIIGGSGFSVLPRRFMEELKVSFGLAGACEQSLPLLLEALDQPHKWSQIPGLWWRDSEGTIVGNRAIPWGIPQETPWLGWQYLDPHRYYEEGGELNIQTKRGCAFRCTFCTYPQLEGRAVWERSAGSVVDEMESWVTLHNVRHFFFVDSVFNAPPEQAMAILSEIRRRELPISWTAYVNPLGLSEPLIEMMLESGCIGIEMGIDSGSDLILKRLRKGFLARHVREALRHCTDKGLKTCVNLIFASPGESMTTVQETIDLLGEFPSVPAIAMVGVRVYPETPVFEAAVSAKLIAPGHDLLQPTFFYSPEFSPECMEHIVSAAKERRNWVIPDLDVNTNLAFFERLRKRRMKGPLWRVLRGGLSAGA